MSIIGLLILCIVVGVGLYLLNMVPMDATFKQIIRVIVILIFVIYMILFIASIFGLHTGIPLMRVR